MTLVRPATADDAAAVAVLEADCLGRDAWSEGLVREGISGRLPTVSYLVAEASAEVIGHAVTSAAGDIAELQRIAVRPSHRRTGVGRQLLAAAVDAASRTEADRMLLEVRADNRGALAFYAAQGFVEIDRRDRYYADGTEAIVMRLALGRGCGAS
ncbi:MAG: ribosomal protein S18-alanine N-acetyltransferase [Marmoricola sp.]|nr:ribosomal protein S18-alanine N-acetyltransferase [Marmoricola sp.]